MAEAEFVTLAEKVVLQSGYVMHKTALIDNIGKKY